MKKGFTLIELIVVIAIIAVLAAIIAPNALKAIDKAKVSATIGDYRSIKTAAMSYYADTSAWPNQSTNGSGLVSDDNQTGWDGPYLESWPKGSFGTITFCADNSTNGCGANISGDDQARYIVINNVSSTNLQSKIDEAVDGTDNDTSGFSRYSGTNVTLVLSSDGTVN